MKKVVKKTNERYVTEKTFKKFESSFGGNMANIARSFSRVEESLGMVVKELKNIHEDNKYSRQNISSLSSDGLSYDRRIDGLTLRVDKLESKLK